MTIISSVANSRGREDTGYFPIHIHNWVEFAIISATKSSIIKKPVSGMNISSSLGNSILILMIDIYSIGWIDVSPLRGFSYSFIGHPVLQMCHPDGIGMGPINGQQLPLVMFFIVPSRWDSSYNLMGILCYRCAIPMGLVWAPSMDNNYHW